MMRQLLRSHAIKWVMIAGAGTVLLLPGACETIILRIATPFLI